MVLRSLIAYSVRVPMIKFRKGGFSGAAAAAPMPSSGGPATAASTPPAAGPAPPAAPVQEEPQVKDPYILCPLYFYNFSTYFHGLIFCFV